MQKISTYNTNKNMLIKNSILKVRIPDKKILLLLQGYPLYSVKWTERKIVLTDNITLSKLMTIIGLIFAKKTVLCWHGIKRLNYDGS